MSAPALRPPPKSGDKFVYERAFTYDEVVAFAHISGDIGAHHIAADAHGRVMVQGLLTASLPTKFAGEHNYVAREMHFEFIRAVHTGDVITTEVICTEVVEEERVIRLSAECICRNQLGKEVMKATTNGVIFK
jgi:acyl dehydratase